MNQIDTPVKGSMGKELYPTPIQLWKQDGSTKNLTNFTTQFTFSITEANSTSFGDGLTFCLLLVNTGILGDAYGGRLGLYNISYTDFNFANNTSIVAVEFDTYRNPWDSSDHHKLASLLQQDRMSNFTKLSIGDSTLEVTVSPTPTHVPSPKVIGSTSKGGLVDDIAGGLSLIIIIGLFIVWRIRSRRKRHGQEVQESNIEATQFDIDDDFDEEAGPKRFGYSELSRATNNLSMEGKLGEGEFGGVYKGLLAGPRGKEIAVKKIKSGSSQGKKEYISTGLDTATWFNSLVGSMIEENYFLSMSSCQTEA
ncbi:hypothetical protein V2J09_000831 [Rumex salicifolius]